MTENWFSKNFERLILNECFACIYVYMCLMPKEVETVRTRVRGGCVLCGSWELNP